MFIIGAFSSTDQLYRRGDQVLVVFMDNSQVTGAAIIDGSIFVEGAKVEATDGKFSFGKFKLNQGETDLDLLYRYVGQEHMHYMLKMSNDQGLMPQQLTDGTLNQSVQYWLWGPLDRGMVEVLPAEIHQGLQ